MKYQINIDPRIVLPEAEKSLEIPAFVKFTGTFEEESASKFRAELNMAESHARAAKQEIIPIVIDSYGGEVYSLLSMIDAIDACEIPIATIVESKAMSCGAILFSCGAEGHRYMAPNATVMIHDVSSMTWGKLEELKVGVAETERLSKVVFERMSKNCGHKKNYFEDLVSKKKHQDWYLNAKEAKSHNLANHMKLPIMQVDIEMRHSFGLPPASMKKTTGQQE
jgi:ATP-dependent Clp protease, protease subunit